MTLLWSTRTLSQVARIRPAKSEARAKLPLGGDVSFLPMEELKANAKYVDATNVRSLDSVVGSYTYFADGDVLLPKISPCFENGKMGIARNLANGIGFGSSEYIVFRPTESITAEWLYYYLSRADMRGEGTALTYGAVGQRRLPKDFIENYPIPIPPLPEQQRIVAILDEVFEGIATARASAEKNLGNARAIFESQLASIFSRQGDGWAERVSLSAVLSAQPRNGWSPPKVYQTGTGAPVLTLSSVTGFEYDGTRVKMSSAPTRDDAHYWLHDGEILITRSNTRNLVGHVAIFDGTPAKAICCDLIMKMTVNPAKALTRFIYFYLRSPGARSYLTGQAQGANPTMVKIGKRVVQDMQLPLPPLSDQQAVVAMLDSLLEESRRLESIYQRKLTALEALKQSLLHHAFSGQL